jgi:hypothetical protein
MSQPEKLTADQLDEYYRLLADNLSGDEQTAMREADPVAYEVWLDRQLMNVPMPSDQKPDINGLREGDHVRLVRAFKSDELRYDVGRTGVVLVIDTAPAQIRLARSSSLHQVYVLGPDGGLIGILRDALELIPGKYDVRYDGDSVGVSIRLSDGDRVEFDRSVKLGEAVYLEGTPGTVVFPQSTTTRAKLAAMNQYAIVLDNGEVEVVPAAILRIGS